MLQSYRHDTFLVGVVIDYLPAVILTCVRPQEMPIYVSIVLLNEDQTCVFLMFSC